MAAFVVLLSGCAPKAWLVKKEPGAGVVEFNREKHSATARSKAEGYCGGPVKVVREEVVTVGQSGYVVGADGDIVGGSSPERHWHMTFECDRQAAK